MRCRSGRSRGAGIIPQHRSGNFHWPPVDFVGTGPRRAKSNAFTSCRLPDLWAMPTGAPSRRLPGQGDCSPQHSGSRLRGGLLTRWARRCRRVDITVYSRATWSITADCLHRKSRFHVGAPLGRWLERGLATRSGFAFQNRNGSDRRWLPCWRGTDGHGGLAPVRDP